MFMGVGAQDDLGGHQSFARKMTWLTHPEKALGFLLKLRRFFGPNCGNLQNKKKKLFTEIEAVFLSKL